jgi:putative ABC transport system substrate-binding protein
VEGQTIALEVRWAEGRNERFPELVAEMVRLKVDVMVVVSTPGALAAKSATQTIPVVMVGVGDPLATASWPAWLSPAGT